MKSAQTSTAKSGGASGARVLGLRCEYLRNPLGIDTRTPRLTWMMDATDPDQKQTAYRIRAASTVTQLASAAADLWDSGKIESDQSAHVPYAGQPLTSGQRCHWQVQVWDREGRPTAFSELAWWEMGLLEPGDWQGRWITWSRSNEERRSPLFRKGFKVGKPVRSARLYLCGIGLYEAHLNGRPIGDQVLARQESILPARALYDTYDVTSLVQTGANALGVWLGPGCWGTQKACLEGGHEDTLLSVIREHKYLLKAQLVLQFADGTRDRVVSDESWRVLPGWLEAVSSAGFYYEFAGEVHDGETRRALRGWNTAAFDDAAWEPARPVDPPFRHMAANMIEPNRVAETLAPVSGQPIPAQAKWLEEYLVSIWERNTGPDVPQVLANSGRLGQTAHLPPAAFRGGMEYDFGKLVSGWARLKVTGAKGDYVSILGLDTYRLSGEPQEEICLRSVHRVFRWLPVLFFGNGKAPQIEEVQALALQNDIRPVGRFACSDAVLQRIHDVAARTYSTQILRGTPMNGPRERVGWFIMGNCEQSLYGLDMGAFHTNWLTDYRHPQRADGYLQGQGGPLTGDLPAWVSDKVGLSILPWLMYLHYGDREILQANYQSMKRFLEFCFRQEGKHAWQGPNGDADAYSYWVNPADESVPDLKADGRLYHDPLVGDLVDTLVMIATLEASIAVAAVLDKVADVNRFERWRERLVKRANRPEFLDRERGVYGAEGPFVNGDMGCQAMALALGIVPEDIREKADARLIHDIMINRHGHLGTGMTGSYYLLRYLIASHRPEVAYTVIRHPTAPSWAALVQNGESMLPEFWEHRNGVPHVTLLSVGFWFYQSLGGIRPDATAPGLKRVIVRPQIVRALTWVKAEYDSIRGTIKSHWTLAGDRLQLVVTIPANASAIIHVPARDHEVVKAPQNATVRFTGMEGEAAVYETGSGTHVFESTLPPAADLRSGVAPDPLSAFKRTWRVSEPIDPGCPAPEPAKLTGKTRTFGSDFVDFFTLHGLRGGLAYAEGDIEAPRAMTTILLLGPDGPCKVWLDGALVGESYVNTNPAVPDTQQFPVLLTKGRHTITVAMDRRGGRAYGFHLRFKRVDGGGQEKEAGALPVMDP